MSHIVLGSLARAFRLQRRRPGEAVLIALTLAVALASSIAVYSVVDALLLREPAFTDPGALDVVSSSFPRMHLSNMGLSGPEANL